MSRPRSHPPIRACAPLLGLLVSLALLVGCGQRAKIVILEHADPADFPIPVVTADPEEEQLPGLRDPSPRKGDRIVGKMTYAYRVAKDPDHPKRGGEVRAGLLSDIDSFNPFLSSSAAASEVQEQIFPRLMYEEPDFYNGVPHFSPQLAESWVIADDNLSIRFRLRPCNWSDGEPITAEDVRFSVQAAKSEEVAWTSASIVDFIKDVEIHGPRDFTVHYTKAQPYNIMDINDTQVIPKHTFGKVPFGKWRGYPNWAALATKAAGGPWVLARHDPNQQIVFKPNPEFWDKGKPYLDQLTFQIFGNKTTMMSALLAGELDILAGVDPDQAKRVLKHEDLLLYTHMSRGYGYAGWNCKRFPFKDARVRQAMTYAINRQDIVEGKFEGYAKVAGPPLISVLWASDRTLKPYPFDPTKAEALLAEAGWKKGSDGVLTREGRRFEFVLYTNQGNPIRKAITERMESDLRGIGVRADIKLIDPNLMSQKLKNHDFQAYLWGWNIATKVDPKPTFHSVSVNGRYNYVNYTDPYVDDLIDRGRVMNIRDPAHRKEAQGIWNAFQQKLYEDQPYTMMYEPMSLIGLNKKFVNVRVTALKWLDNVHEWWIE